MKQIIENLEISSGAKLRTVPGLTVVVIRGEKDHILAVMPDGILRIQLFMLFCNVTKGSFTGLRYTKG